MRRSIFLQLAIGGLLCGLTACGKLPETETEPETSQSASQPKDAAIFADVTLETALDQALQKGWRHLHILTSRSGDAGFESLEIFSGGAGIWNGERQVELSRDALGEALELFRSSGFTDLPELLDKRGGELAKQVRCKVLLELDGQRKEVTLLEKADPVSALLELSDGLFDLARPTAAQDRSLTDLASGLSQMAAGELAPEFLQVLAHSKPELGEEGEGWLIDLRGGRATVRPFATSSGYGEPRTILLSEEQMRLIASSLLEARVWELPANLADSGYRELKVGLLNHQSAVVARSFAGRDPAAEVEQRERLDSVFAVLQELHG